MFVASVWFRWMEPVTEQMGSEPYIIGVSVSVTCLECFSNTRSVLSGTALVLNIPASFPSKQGHTCGADET